MATVGTPVPPPVKNEWLSSALDPKLSPPSPGGPRKAAPMTTVSSLRSRHSQNVFDSKYVLFLLSNREWLVVHHHHQHHSVHCLKLRERRHRYQAVS